MIPNLKDSGVISTFRSSFDLLMVATQNIGGTVFSLRWTDPDTLFRLEKLKMSTVQNVAATATIMPRYDAWIARNFTASDSAGTPFTANSGRKRTKYPKSKITDLRGSIGLAAGLTVGTRTLDTHPFLTLNSNLTITTPNPILYSNAADMEAGEYPIVLEANEGIVIIGPATAFGAAGQSELLVEIAWSEIAP